MKPEFNPDGSIKIPAKAKIRKTPEEKVIHLIEQLNYPVGKRLLAEILKGEFTARVKKLKLNHLPGYGSLELYDFPDIYRLLDKMLFRGMIKVEKSHKTGFLPVIAVMNGYIDTDSDEMNADDFDKVTDEDRKIFEAFGDFLEGYNDEQKKCIIDNSKRLLCVAGAGSGKTTVLTKKIEFLIKYRSVESERILAITFTRKARQEMMSRLADMIPGHRVRIETFNSFCEKLLKENEEIIYDKPCRVMNYKDKIQLFQEACSEIGVSTKEALEKYYSRKKLRETDSKTLFFGLINDVFSIIENCKNNNKGLSETRAAINNLEKNSEKNAALFIYSIIQKIEKYKSEKGLRDYTDQLVDGLALIRKQPGIISGLEHVLVDEFQDVNELQVQILQEINPGFLFAVGDPRQSIYGWRGSKVEYIMNFKNHYPESKIIQLSKNYRSCSEIVETGNIVVKGMNLPPLRATRDKLNDITLINNSDEEKESLFAAQSILSQNVSNKNIFVLVRTNKQAELLAEVFEQHKIGYLKRTVEEQKQKLEPAENEVTISTVHAIKGLEADVVYLLGVNSNSFPCLVSDKPVIDQMKLNNHYDKYNEELRLLYVAMTRAKKQLIISYYNTLSPFITKEVLDRMRQLENGSRKVTSEDKLRQWRLEKSREFGLKPYMVFSDKALFQLLAMRPKSYDELITIPGIGENKVDKFGDELLDIVNSL